MSPATDNFIHSLVEMSKAFEELPTVKSELNDCKAENDAAYKMVQSREEAIQRYKAEIEALQAKVRDTEAQRDDAELRFLEADDRTHKALDFIKTTFGSAGSVIQSLEPPAPEPVPVAEPVPEAQPVPVEQSPYYNPPMQEQGQSEPSPTPAPVAQTGTGTESVTSSSEGQSEANPTVEAHSAPTESVATPSNVSESVSQPDDVGYHNEPTFDGQDWTKWDSWADRMNARYGIGAWPVRSNVVNIA